MYVCTSEVVRAQLIAPCFFRFAHIRKPIAYKAHTYIHTYTHTYSTHIHTYTKSEWRECVCIPGMSTRTKAFILGIKFGFLTPDKVWFSHTYIHKLKILMGLDGILDVVGIQ